jgi:hypothetical protein
VFGAVTARPQGGSLAGGRGGQWRARREREAVDAKKENDSVRMQQPLEIGGMW